MKYDLIVVGAGPAGFLAAKAAGENGHDVLSYSSISEGLIE